MTFKQVNKDITHRNFISQDMPWYDSSGVYLMIFSNGMKYLGKSNKLGSRLSTHISEFRFGKNWHEKLNQQGKTFHDTIQWFRNNVQFFICECEPEDLYEKYCLSIIKNRGEQDQYYNAQYPKELLLIEPNKE